MVQFLRHCTKSLKVVGSNPDSVIDLILPVKVWPGIDSASHRNEFKEHFLGGKDGRCVRLTTFMCRPS